jgi:hypothetical protein
MRVDHHLLCRASIIASCIMEHAFLWPLPHYRSHARVDWRAGRGHSSSRCQCHMWATSVTAVLEHDQGAAGTLLVLLFGTSVCGCQVSLQGPGIPRT